jgi:hypothetical protein
LLFVLVEFLLTVVGLGILALKLIRLHQKSLSETLLGSICAGMLTITAACTALDSLSLALRWANYTSIAGLCILAFEIWAMRTKTCSSKLIRKTLPHATLICVVLFGLFFKILSDPISSWDARSIWFFHSKIIYSVDSLTLAPWDHPSISFSHPEYPKLLATLAALIASQAGYWNEHLPKFALCILLIPPTLTMTFISPKSHIRYISFIVIILNMGHLIWLGLMDGYLSLYAATPIILYRQYLEKRNYLHCAIAILLLGICLMCKDEAKLWLLCVIASLALLNLTALKSFFKSPRLLPVALLATIPSIGWHHIKSKASISSPYLESFSEAINRAIERVADGSLLLIATEWFSQSSLAISVLVGLLLLRLSYLEVKLKWIRTPLLATAFYLLGLLAVYLSTPWPLKWQLETSAGRVLFLPSTVVATILMVVIGMDAEPTRSALRSFFPTRRQ